MCSGTEALRSSPGGGFGVAGPFSNKLGRDEPGRTLRIEGGSGYERSCVCLDCRHRISPCCHCPPVAHGFGHASCCAGRFHPDVGQRDRVGRNRFSFIRRVPLRAKNTERVKSVPPVGRGFCASRAGMPAFILRGSTMELLERRVRAVRGRNLSAVSSAGMAKGPRRGAPKAEFPTWAKSNKKCGSA
jgi:hypothetical protein